ncbi:MULTISPECIES: NAD-dependent succinate-semialdehyde dehydrogenase [unclassified Streptomyces]|uniref:NAD-dependent succinate-semialdehyde dehydrogenase n=1 Tax=unclassified Streptomyces TaxID=2593676 RepID=UPI002E2967BE|nr:NAD-dependent succinate-semialdehyde dehydrogenase [Streptomyces sp. NBC_00223]
MTGLVESGLLIDGVWAEAAGGKRFDVLDPASGRRVGSAADAGADDVARAVDAAAAALPAWRSTTAHERARVLRQSATVIRDRADGIAEVMTAEQGKPLTEARGEVEYAASFFDWFAGEAERVYGQVVPATNPSNRVLVLRQPVGVVAAITPWNFPAALAARKLAAAMAAGCTSIVKPAEATPLTAALLLGAVNDAGCPAGVANLVTPANAVEFADTVFADARVRKISFTGSTTVGKQLIRRSADQVKRLSLELGGHAPYLVFADADLDQAVEGIMLSKFRNAGQTCVCANRVYVQRPVYRQVVEMLAERTAALKVGSGSRPGTDIGPLIDARAVEKAHTHVQDAVDKGARIVTGGTRLTDGEFADGFFYAPTVLDGVTPEMLISVEETFGPVAGVTAFDTEAEAVRLANDSTYGLSAYFHTRDYARLLRVAEQLDYGVVGANTGIISAASVPFGGMKESGYGREGGSLGIDEYLEYKYVLVAGVTE